MARSAETVTGRRLSGFRARLARLRPVLLLVVAAAVGGWLMVEMFHAYRQRSAVHLVWRLGGSIQREYDRPGTDSVVPGWYRLVFGEDFLNPVVLVRLGGTEASDEDLVSVGRLTQLRMLDLRDTRISDNGLRHLRRLPHVQVLSLTGTAVSDRGLAQLTGMTELKVLCLEETRITDVGLTQLQKFPDLGWLNLSNSPITAEGLARLRGCRSLEVLIIDPGPGDEDDAHGLQAAVPSLQVYDGSRRRPAFHSFHSRHFK